MNSQARTAALTGIDGQEIRVEVDISRGLPGFHLVGLPSAEVRESRQRVLSALRNSGCDVPPGRITVNLAPAGVRKEGASLDLAIALGIVSAASRLAPDPGRDGRSRALLLGELSLFGQLRPVRGLLAMVLAGVQQGAATVVVPGCQTWEAGLVPGIKVVGAETLREVVTWWAAGQEPGHGASVAPVIQPLEDGPEDRIRVLDRLTVSLRGMPLLRKAAVVALAGRHNLLLTGPPGSGKTRLARLMGRLQPPLSRTEALDVTRIHSAAGTLRGTGLAAVRPFRAPHHSLTRAGLVGGGAALRPGEVTLAHQGMLFLDELAEFAPGVLDVLREPLEDGVVSLARGSGRRTYPASFQLVAAMNPCRCGYLGSRVRPCQCSGQEVRRYRARLGGPLLDRFDLFVEVAAWQGEFLKESSAQPQGGWRERPRPQDLERAWQARRPGKADLTAEARDYLEGMRTPLGLSLRAVHRCLRVAGTLAVLDRARVITRGHVLEALEFRQGPGDWTDPAISGSSSGPKAGPATRPRAKPEAGQKQAGQKKAGG